MEQNHYRQAEELLAKLAASVQRQDAVDLAELAPGRLGEPPPASVPMCANVCLSMPV